MKFKKKINTLNKKKNKSRKKENSFYHKFRPKRKIIEILSLLKIMTNQFILGVKVSET